MMLAPLENLKLKFLILGLLPPQHLSSGFSPSADACEADQEVEAHANAAATGTVVGPATAGGAEPRQIRCESSPPNTPSATMVLVQHPQHSLPQHPGVGRAIAQPPHLYG